MTFVSEGVKLNSLLENYWLAIEERQLFLAIKKKKKRKTCIHTPIHLQYVKISPRVLMNGKSLAGQRNWKGDAKQVNCSTTRHMRAFLRDKVQLFILVFLLLLVLLILSILFFCLNVSLLHSWLLATLLADVFLLHLFWSYSYISFLLHLSWPFLFLLSFFFPL